MTVRIARRTAMALLGAACAVPAQVVPNAFAQQHGRVRRIGVLSALLEHDPETIARDGAFRQGLEKLGWKEGGNIHILTRYAAGSGDQLRANAEELVKLHPELIVTYATTALSAIQMATRDIPIVFVQVTDPVGAGYVASLARPGGNITGLTQHEFSIGLKWLELLKEIVPSVRDVAVLYDPRNPATTGYLKVIEEGARPVGIRLSPLAIYDSADIERGLTTMAGSQNSGLIILPGAGLSIHRDAVIALADQLRLPAVYPFRYWTKSGGLAFYGVDNIDLYRRAATYVDRVLKGDRPGDLPVQHATTFELVLNLKTAKKLGLEFPSKLLFTADEVIE
jgi:putative ABC transport system substrate-binding protein